eukprot:9792228-Prorocentrum_lima.AAC.1
MTSSLVGSEMCIRDSLRDSLLEPRGFLEKRGDEISLLEPDELEALAVSYTHLTLPTICSV